MAVRCEVDYGEEQNDAGYYVCDLFSPDTPDRAYRAIRPIRSLALWVRQEPLFVDFQIRITY